MVFNIYIAYVCVAATCKVVRVFLGAFAGSYVGLTFLYRVSSMKSFLPNQSVLNINDAFMCVCVCVSMNCNIL